MKTTRIRILASACSLLATILAQPAKAQTINPGIIDPTTTYADKTYGEWSAAWWQYFENLPTTNNPLVYGPSHLVPLGIGQRGPVWFLSGNFANGGTHSCTNTIPGGTALFYLVSDVRSDNANCPTQNNYNRAQLLAFASPEQDNATNMSCTIDGIAVSGLTNGLTTPYRVQSPLFNFTCPAVHNFPYDIDNLHCYSNNTGTPYTVNGAVSDGVFLMIEPLSAGPHVIHVTVKYPAFSYSSDATQHLNVNPVALTLDASGQPGLLVLSWPQTPDTYTLQISSKLNPPDWRSADLVVITNNGLLQATAPVGMTNQFFRLQLK